MVSATRSGQDDEEPDVAELADISRQIAAEAAALVAERARGSVTVSATKSSGADLVTEADRAAEELIRKRLTELRPHDGVLGEEGGSQAGASGITWIIDPIDGTTNFVRGMTDYAVSVAAAYGTDPHSWQLLAGTVHAPARQEAWSAGLGLGTWRDQHRLWLERPAALDASLVATGFAYRPEQRVEQAGLLRHVMAHISDIRRLGSAAVDLALIAEGQVDGFFEQFLNPWDVAAGLLLVTEAGGTYRHVPGLSAEPIVVAGHPEMCEALENLLHEAREAEGTTPRP